MVSCLEHTKLIAENFTDQNYQKNAGSEKRDFKAHRLIQSLYRQSVSEAQAVVSVLLLVLTLPS